MKDRQCSDCEVELNEDNTREFDGFDSGNFLASSLAGFGFPAELFIKCDDCFNAGIDRALDNLYN